MNHRAPIDWSVLSGPRVSRRTLMQVAAASGAAAYAAQLAMSGQHPPPGARRARFDRMCSKAASSAWA
jgi:hypothetical protein